jgi:purine-nucleoside phosphorylase
VSDVESAVKVIAARAGGAAPRVGLILGSGLGALADAVEDATIISYGDLPGFPAPGVAGHEGRLLLGTLAGTPVAVLQGRAHYYETGRADAMKVPVRTLAGIGCESLLLTNAAGSLVPEAGPGSVMLITDHIGFTGVSPLFGETGNGRFVDMTGAYDADLADRLRAAATREDIALAEGVYMWFCGPHYETAAEVRAARVLGADAVGMSTVPEVILARHAGLRVAALSIVTNLATGVAEAPVTHAAVLESASAAAAAVRRLLLAFFAAYDRPGA